MDNKHVIDDEYIVDEKDIPEYNRIDYEYDDLGVQRAKREAIKKQFQQENNNKK